MPLLSVSAALLSSTLALLGTATYPEGVAVDPRTGNLFVGSNGDGSIQVIHEGVAREFQPAGADGRSGALGIKVDAQRDRLWVAAGDAVYIYDISRNALLKKLPLADLATTDRAALNDIALTEDGSAYVTDSFNPIVLKVDGRSLEMTVFKNVADKIPYGRQNDFPYNLNGIVVGSNQTLISVKTNDGTLWRIGLFTEDVHEIKLAEPVTKGDGLVLVSGILFVIRNFENKISRIDLNRGSDDQPRAVETFSPEGLQVPTTAAYLGPKADALGVVNSQFDKDVPVLPFHVLVLPLNELSSVSSAHPSGGTGPSPGR